MIGAAVGYRLYDIAVVLAAIDFVTLRFLRPVKQELGMSDSDPRPDAEAAPRARGDG